MEMVIKTILWHSRDFTHYSEVNHRTLKDVVSYGPNIGHIPHAVPC